MPVSVRRPRAIIFDILGTASKSGFLEKILFPFLKNNLESYVQTHWLKRDFMKLFSKIEVQSREFHSQEPSTPVVLTHEQEGAKQSLLDFINFVTDNGINSTAVTQLRFKVWFEGYQQSRLKTPIYSDVPNRIRVWFAEGIKFYVFSNTWVEAQKALLRNTNHGDLTNLISGHYDNDFGSIVDTESWTRLCGEIKESPNDVLFLTKAISEARAACDAGVSVVLVLTHRHNVKAISHEDRQRFPLVRTLNELNWVEGSMMPASTGTGASSMVAGGPTNRSSMRASSVQAGASSNPNQMTMPTSNATGNSSATARNSQAIMPTSTSTSAGGSQSKPSGGSTSNRRASRASSAATSSQHSSSHPAGSS